MAPSGALTVTPKARDEPGVAAADQLCPPKHPCPFPEMRVLFCGGMTVVSGCEGDSRGGRHREPLVCPLLTPA